MTFLDEKVYNFVETRDVNRHNWSSQMYFKKTKVVDVVIVAVHFNHILRLLILLVAMYE